MTRVEPIYTNQLPTSSGSVCSKQAKIETPWQMLIPYIPYQIIFDFFCAANPDALKKIHAWHLLQLHWPPHHLNWK